MDASKAGQALTTMPRPTKLALSCLPLAFALSACGGQMLDVGSNTHDTAGSSSGGSSQPTAGTSANFGGFDTSVGGTTPVPPNGDGGAGTETPQNEPEPALSWPDASSCGAGTSPLAGRWSGYVQGQGDEYNFNLDLGDNGDAPCGTITFGAPQAYPPATDPEAGYLDGDENFKHPQMLPGFAYTLLELQVDSARLRFRVGFAEPYASWCALQTAYADPQGGYTCIHDYGSGAWHTGGSCYQKDSAGNQQPVSCAQYGMCESIDPPCACQATGCQANSEGSGPSFDLHVSGTSATGAMSDQDVFLEKQ